MHDAYADARTVRQRIIDIGTRTVVPFGNKTLAETKRRACYEVWNVGMMSARARCFMLIYVGRN